MEFFTQTGPTSAPQPHDAATQPAAMVQQVVIDIPDEAFGVEDGASVPPPVVYWQYPMTGPALMPFFYAPHVEVVGTESLDPLPPV